MADFDYISIDTKAENIEKIANMEIVTSLLSENNTNEELPTAKATFDTVQKVNENISRLDAKTDNGIEALSVWNTAKGGEKALTVNDVSSLIHKCSLKLTSEDGNIYKLNNENFELESPPTTFDYEIKENGILVLNGHTESVGISALFYLKNLTIGEQYTFSILDVDSNFTAPNYVFYLEENGSVGEEIENTTINNNCATFTPAKSTDCVAILSVGAAAEEPLVNEILYPQLVLGNKPVQKFLNFSSVKVYVNGQGEYTPNIDGTVVDIERHYPTMEITTNNQNVNISDFTYCVDTKKYIDNNSGGSLTVDQTYNPESENAQSGKAIAEAVSGKADIPKDYELIETITTEEGVSTISLNQEPNGNAYSFKDIFVKFTWNGETNRNWVLLEISADEKNASAFYEVEGMIAMATSWIRTLYCYGHRMFLFSARTTNLGYANQNSALPVQILDTDKSIDAIKIQNQDAFPTGTVIEIWGVRA